jgi:hypothetical protein
MDCCQDGGSKLLQNAGASMPFYMMAYLTSLELFFTLPLKEFLRKKVYFTKSD